MSTLARTKGRPRRSRVDRATTVWMIIAAILVVYTVAFGGSLPQQWWLVVHVVTLGVLTNAILQWSWYFTRSLLRLKAEDRHAGTHQTIRVVFFNLGVVGLVAAMIVSNTAGAVVAAAVIGAVILWHLLALVLASRTALGARFAVIVRYYVSAAAMLAIGIIYGAFDVVALTSPSSPATLVQMSNNLTVAHFLLNALGFVGLTIAGTLVTLGPTALRTRMDPDAVPRAVRALPFLVASVLGAAASTTFGMQRLAGVFVLVYLAALVAGIGVSLAHAVRRKGLNDYATWSFALGAVWSVAGLGWLAGVLFSSGFGAGFGIDFDAGAGAAVRESMRLIVAVIGIGGVLQILIGALSYLLPVVVGGGPSVVKQGILAIEAGSGMRLAARNSALLAAVLVVLGGLNVPGVGVVGAFAAIVGAAYFMDIVGFAQAGVAQARAKRARTAQARAKQATAKGATSAARAEAAQAGGAQAGGAQQRRTK